MDEYLVPTGYGEDEFYEKKSHFIGRAWPVETEEEALAKSQHHVIVVLPYSMGGMVETLHNNAQVKNVEYTAEGIEVETVVDDILYGRLRDYIAMEL